MLFRSDEDHVVDDSSHRALLRALPSTEMVRLTNSYHVATLDNDADLIFESSVRFVLEHELTGSTRQAAGWNQPIRRAPVKGMEFRPVIRTPLRGLAASTILPLPM